MLFDWLHVLSYLLLLSWTATAEQFYVVPSHNKSCPRDPCYTLTDVAQNSSRYFASNTVIIFLAGNHQTNITKGLSLLIKDVRNISMIGYDHTNSDSKSVIQCTGPLGFAFINVTEVKIAKLKFSSCGAHFPRKFTVTKIPNMSVTFYFLQTINVTISELAISNSTGAGLVGINMFGFSNISQTVFSGNRPNCLLLFLNIHPASEVISPNIFSIKNSQVMFGKLPNFSQTYNLWGTTGLNIMVTQTTYNVNIHIDNIKIYRNMNKKRRNGNLRFFIENWECQCSVIQAKNITSTNMIRREDKIQVHLESKAHGSLPTCNCTKPAEKEYTVSISDSYFVGVGIRVYADINYIYCYTRIKLQNITVQNSTAFALHISGMKSIKIQDMTFTYTTGISIEDSNIIASGRCQFIHNTGHAKRGIAAFYRSTISFHGDIKFIENKVHGLAVITAYNSTMRFQKTAELVANRGRVGGAIGLFDNSQLVLGEQSETTFLRNHAQQNGGAILVDGSTIVVESEARVEFIDNEAYNGGAIAFQNDARITLKSHSQITFKKNHAQQNGGALYVEEPILKYTSYFDIERIKCFIQLQPKLSSQAMMFSNNNATTAGSSLYGGWINYCTTGASEVSHNITKVLFHFQEPLPQLSPVSSNPTRVCVCNNDFPNCSITHYNVTAYPGETFQIPAVAVGQSFGTVPFTVHSRLSQINSPPEIKALQGTQKVRGTCTNLIYTIASSHQIEEMVLTVDKLDKLPAEYIAQHQDKNELPLVFRNLHLHIQLKPCPLGFVLNISVCTCNPQLTQSGINCSIDTQKVYRQSSKWINATFINTSQYGVLVHNHCPFDYCRPDSFDLNLNNPDEQCAFQRSGILCGACQNNLSHVFGLSTCRECTSLWALLWVPVIALAGVALVVLLIGLNLTVSVGTINGLVFYANIVRANHATFFPPDTTNSFLSWFIAWINLDLGIETCFYNGLDAYVKTWLQFVFPLYIWLIVVLIIVFSHYFDKIAKLSGKNAVQVLATLFLLSYAKLLRIIITVFSFTLIKYPDKTVKVWLYDGNVNYIQGKHIPLIVVAVMLLLAISVPYTGMLLFIQCFQKFSSHKLLSWIHKLKPLLDAYTGPYKDRHRYWTGLLLLVRAILFLIFSVANPDINLLVITLTAFSLLTHGAVAGQIYKTWILNTIEYSFLLNLGVLSCATFYTRASDQEDSRGATSHSQTEVVYTSVATALVTFTVIVVMHIVKKAKSFPQCNRAFSEQVTSKLLQLRGRATLAMKRKHHHSPLPSPAASPTSIQLRESLLEYCVND